MNTVTTHHGYCTRFVADSTVRTSPKSQEEQNIEGLQLHTRPCHTGFYNRAVVLVVFYTHRPARPQGLSRVLQYGHLPQQMGCSVTSASNLICCLQYVYSSLGGRRRKRTRLALFARDLVVHESSSGVRRHLGHFDSEIPAVGERRQHFSGFMRKEDKIWPSLMKREHYRRVA